MSQAFNGAVLCTKQRIQKALNNYKKVRSEANQRVECMKDDALATRERFMFIFNPTIWSQYNNFGRPTKEMRDKLLSDVSDEDLDIYNYGRGTWDLTAIVEYLEYPASECYINIDQAAFIINWENRK